MSEVAARPPKVIKDELGDLNKLIVENARLIEQFPEDLSLIIGMKSLQHRRNQLFTELEESEKLRTQRTFDAVLTGESVSGSEISLSFLGDFCSSLQDTITSIVQKDYRGETSSGSISNEVKNLALLNVAATAPGSFRIIISSNPAIDTPASFIALEKFNSLIECGADIQKIKDIRGIVGTRVINKYKRFIHVLKSNKANITLYDQFKADTFTPRTVTKELASTILRVIEDVEEMPEQLESYSGRIRGIDTHDKSFHFELPEGRHIRGKYSDHLDSAVKRQVLDEEVIATFKHTIKYAEATDREYDEWELIELKQS
ncbi:hypothetical protein FGW20_06300 [Methanoculleus sp. FWC-SCC3]|uniref:Uncharacterized protein n=1 Tax=Methanoculleus methanifontis TaxID=2584086 RepID=A0ABT8M0U6_9EURY|nr:hypothetical protein [Methanoculleus sp. FWC-SCC3]MDN7012655.1 hypothetical protein [Methanoculleus sp. FWC-SCC3]